MVILRSGGQTGVDRAALEVALERGLGYRGWCPRGGWAEDLPEPPGLLARFPELRETPSADPRQRTAWNVRDADATLLVLPRAPADAFPGTRLTELCAELVFAKPWRVLDLDDPELEMTAVWLAALARERAPSALDLNIAGPRESESPGIQRASVTLLLDLLDRAARKLAQGASRQA